MGKKTKNLRSLALKFEPHPNVLLQYPRNKMHMSKGWDTANSSGKQRLLGVLGPVPVDFPPSPLNMPLRKFGMDLWPSTLLCVCQFLGPPAVLSAVAWQLLGIHVCARSPSNWCPFYQLFFWVGRVRDPKIDHIKSWYPYSKLSTGGHVCVCVLSKDLPWEYRGWS